MLANARIEEVLKRNGSDGSSRDQLRGRYRGELTHILTT